MPMHVCAPFHTGHLLLTLCPHAVYRHFLPFKISSYADLTSLKRASASPGLSCEVGLTLSAANGKFQSSG
jgi:hypothetical protein